MSLAQSSSLPLAQNAAALAADLATRCDKATATATGWKACCPAHDDQTPSLSITPEGDKVLVHCFAGCAPEAIVAALGLTMQDLFVTPAPRVFVLPPPVQHIVATYAYTDAQGVVLHETVRKGPRKDFLQRRPDGQGGWLWNLDGIELVLYHLPTVLEAVRTNATIYCCEGEKDADTVTALGLVATCNPLGAGKWQPSYTDTLRGAWVVLLPDNDAPGRDHGAMVAKALDGIAAGVKVLALPDLSAKGDVSDWVQTGGTRDALEALVHATPQWVPGGSTTSTAGTQTAAPPARTPAVRRSARALLDLQLPPLTWVIEDILPAGCTLLTGKSKDGKSLMAYNLAVAVVSGGKALGRYAVTSGSVWYLALEDGERRAQSRLRHQAMLLPLPPGADERLHFTCWEAPRLGEGLEEDIREWVTTTPDARLVIIDILEKIRPLRKQNGNVYAEDYVATANLTRLAQEQNFAILIVHHSNKSNPSDFRDSASGAMSLVGGADNYWSLSRQPLSEDATLKITGRDIVQEQDLAMQFKDGYWTALGEASLVKLSHERQAIVDAIQDAGKPLTPKAIASAIGKNHSTTKALLAKLLQARVLIQPFDGHYDLSPLYTTTTVVPVVSVNSVVPVVSVVSTGHIVTLGDSETTEGLRETTGDYGGTTADNKAQLFDISAQNGGRDYETTETTGVSRAPEVIHAPEDMRTREETTHGLEGGALVCSWCSTLPPVKVFTAPVPASAPLLRPPESCPGCGAPTTWRDHPDYWECYKLLCGSKVLKAVQS